MPLSHSHHLPSAAVDPPRFSHDVDSSCSTPFVSAPSSPAHAPPSGYFYSAPASPMHFHLSDGKNQSSAADYGEPVFLTSDSGSFEFEFSSRFSPTDLGNGSMTSADELFFNGQIRPTERRFLDLCGGESSARGRDLKSSGKCTHRKARSMSPLRAAEEYELRGLTASASAAGGGDRKESAETTPSCSASSSRSSSSGRNSKKWIFLKDLLHRSKSEGRANGKERFWSAISFSPAKKAAAAAAASPALSPSSSRDEKRGGGAEARRGAKAPAAAGKPANGVWRRRAPPPSAHERHYTANRAQAEEMKKKTFLPYRQGLLGCLGFSSKSYGAFTGFTRNLNPISSR